jgi:heterodisulfide reductase subunit C
LYLWFKYLNIQSVMSFHKKNDLSQEVLDSTGVSSAKCYQCGKCSAGCPMAGEMDYPPSMIMRFLQTGIESNDTKVLASKSIWYCLTCGTCKSRCPQEVDIPVVMDHLRKLSIERHLVHRDAKKILAFHESFLTSINNTGRLHEINLIANYKLKTLDLMQDVLLAPIMFAKGKLPIFPERIKGIKNIKSIFNKTKKK